MDVGGDVYVGECVFDFLFKSSPVCLSVVCVCVSVLYELIVSLCVVCYKNGQVV